jgi:hypothetical protein
MISTMLNFVYAAVMIWLCCFSAPELSKQSISIKGISVHGFVEPLNEILSFRIAGFTENDQTSVSHAIWNQLLQKYVGTDGKVNYRGLKKDVSKLDAYLAILEKNHPADNWKKEEKMAFWINAYNAFTVKLIVDNYPVSRIMNLDGGKTWDIKRIKTGGKSYSLNNIEHDILRAQFKDARIHFALNCAAKSCPPLFNQAFTADNLEASLQRLTANFINNKKFNNITTQGIWISKIFDWYANDFGNLIEYLNRYSTVKIDRNTKVSYLNYDWNLNE